MTWNHRIIKHDIKKPAYFAIHEVFYEEDGKINGWTQDPIDISGESREEILRILKQISLDIKTPVLNESKLLKATMNKTKIKLVQTSIAYPEQYDAFLGNQIVGYLRLRGGSFRVNYPNFEGKIIYEAQPNGDGFFSDDERDFYLNKAIKVIERELAKKSE